MLKFLAMFVPVLTSFARFKCVRNKIRQNLGDLTTVTKTKENAI